MEKVHFLGIGGSGASAAAAIASSQGFEVTGCDISPKNEFTRELKDNQLFTSHSPKHLRSIDILAVTPAVYSLDPKNKELIAAKEKGIEVLTWQEFTGKYLMRDNFVIAISGTHGKTTTTAMIAKILEDSGYDPTVIIGAIVPKWKANYRVGKGKPALSGAEGYFVVEADEYNDNFLPYSPDISVVTNIEMDHPEYFKNLEAVKKSFKKFLGSTKRVVIANLQDPVVKSILNGHPGGVHMIIDYSKKPIDFDLQVPGNFNQLNAQAAFQVGLLLGIDPENIRKSLSNFTGAGRRFERLGNYKGREVYSDFGHHPTEIKLTMEATRKKFPEKYIWFIFQPHMFSRTKALFKEFVEVFKNLPVNQILIMDIYPSREMDTGVVSSEKLADAANKDSVDYIPSEDELKKIIDSKSRPADILFFMGAGDIDKFARNILEIH